MSQFDDETQLHFLATGQSTGQVYASWNIGTNPNGGYLMALAVAALRAQVPQHTDPVSVTVHYLRPGLSEQPCQVEHEVLRTGATLSTGRAKLVQQDKTCLELMAAFGELSATDQSGLTLAAPAMPSPDHCVTRSGEAQGIALPIMDRLDIRLHRDEFKAGSTARAQVSASRVNRTGPRTTTIRTRPARSGVCRAQHAVIESHSVRAPARKC